MNRKLCIGLVAGTLAGLAMSATIRLPEAMGQEPREEGAWEYKVAEILDNPGDRMTDTQRSAAYEKTLNEHARQGWETVGSIMSQSVVQTVGGGGTTRESVSFVALSRPKR